MSLACSRAHLGLAGGHVILMAQGWQSCLVDKGIAPSLYYNNAITALGSWPELLYHCFLLFFWVNIVPSRTNLRKSCISPLQSERSLQALCLWASLAHRPVGAGDLCIGWSGEHLTTWESKQQLWRWRCEFECPNYLLDSGPWHWLVLASMCVHQGEKGKKGQYKIQGGLMVQCGMGCSSCAGRCVSRGLIMYWVWILWVSVIPSTLNKAMRGEGFRLKTT